MKHMHAFGWAVSVAVAATTALTLAGCGSSGHPAKDAAKSPKATAMATSKITGNRAPKFVGVQDPIPSGPALTNTPNMYKYVLKNGCSSVSGGWQAVGTAQNTTAKPLAFKVLVFFTDAQARIVDSASTTVTVPAKAKGTWTAERQFKAPKGTQCVVRAVTKG